jgi:TonB family protein
MMASIRRRNARRFLEPQLQPRWESRWTAMLSNLRAALTPLRGTRQGAAVVYFRDTWVESRFPARTMVFSLAAHIALAYLPFPEWQRDPLAGQLELAPVEYTLYLPPRDLPPVRPPGPPGKSGAREQQPQPPPKLGADAYHPRQTIVSRPLRPTHPRQTLIQPDAPPEAPRILPPLPNIVDWSESPQPAPPRLDPRALSARDLRARPRERAEAADVSAPEVAAVPVASGDIPLAADAPAIDQPRLAVNPLAATRAGPARSAGPDVEEAPSLAPNLAGVAGAAHRLIALSASPAAPGPSVQVPPGNLEANITIGPAGSAPGIPWGEPAGTGAGGNGAGGTGIAGSGTGAGAAGSGTGGGEGVAGPPGISITGGDPSGGPAVAGPARPAPARPLPERPAPRLDLSVPADRTPPAAAIDRAGRGTPAEQVLGPRRIYTLHVNMPNLTSVTGSWVLRFAEMDIGAPVEMRLADELTGPLPLRKVDPRYPPALAKARIEGEVILYAIIRRDGTVDSIQVVRGLEPELDANAMEALARWRFKPAERGGQPVDLEAVVTIPFRATAPL